MRKIIFFIGLIVLFAAMISCEQEINGGNQTTFAIEFGLVGTWEITRLIEAEDTTVDITMVINDNDSVNRSWALNEDEAVSQDGKITDATGDTDIAMGTFTVIWAEVAGLPSEELPSGVQEYEYMLTDNTSLQITGGDNAALEAIFDEESDVILWEKK